MWPPHTKNISILGVVLLLHLHCSWCCFCLHQSRRNCFTITSASLMDILISLKFNWFVMLWQLCSLVFLSSVFPIWHIRGKASVSMLKWNNNREMISGLPFWTTSFLHQQGKEMCNIIWSKIIKPLYCLHEYSREKMKWIQVTYGYACLPLLPPPRSQGRCPQPGWSSPGSPSGLPLIAASHVASGNLPEPWPSHALWKTLWMGKSIMTVKPALLVYSFDCHNNGTAQNKLKTYPLNTPRTKLRTKKDPKMTRLTK